MNAFLIARKVRTLLILQQLIVMPTQANSSK